MTFFCFFFYTQLNFIVGSETNTVHLYQREISRPLLSYKFDEQNNSAPKTVTNPTVRILNGIDLFDILLI